KFLDWLHQAANIQQKHQQVGQVQRGIGDARPSGDHHCRGHKLRERRHAVEEERLGFVTGFAALQEAVVLRRKLSLLELVVRKSFHHPDSSQRIFHLDVDSCNVLLIPLQCSSQPAAEKHSISRHKRQKEEHHQDQFQVDVQQDQECPAELHRVDHQI